MMTGTKVLLPSRGRKKLSIIKVPDIFVSDHLNPILQRAKNFWLTWRGGGEGFGPPPLTFNLSAYLRPNLIQ